MQRKSNFLIERKKDASQNCNEFYVRVVVFGWSFFNAPLPYEEYSVLLERFAD